METFFDRYKNSLVLTLVLFAQFILLAVQVRPGLPGAAAADQAGVKVLRLGVNTVVTPPEKVLHQSGLSLRGIWSSYVNLIDVKEQNEQLLAENQRLQMEQAALAEDARQGERLQEILAFKQHYVDTTVPAQVLGSSGSDHERVLSIDKGSDDGIAPEMPVITPDGIVGRVREVTAHSSQVLEISDSTSAVGILLEQTRTRGILRGDNVGHAQIVNLMPDDRIKPGQLVLTSGGDQIFPRGLPVGVVDKVVPDVDNQPLVNVMLKPAANLSRLEEVLVVTGTGTGPSIGARHDLVRSETTAAGIKAAAVARAAQAAEAALEAQRASDILAARLPSASNESNPDAPDASPGSSPLTADSNAAPLHPPSALHPDHYSPTAAISAQSLIPGERSAPLAEGVPPTVRVVKPVVDGDAASIPSPSVSPAFRAAHDAAVAARPHPQVALPAAGSLPSTTRVATATGAASAVSSDGMVMRPLIHRIPQLNSDGTPVLNADGTPAVKRIPVLNADGTPVMQRVPVPTPHPVLNADGTVAKPVVRHVVAVAGGTGAAPSMPGTAASPSASRADTPAAPARPRAAVPTQVVNDGPLPSSSTVPKPQASRKRTPALVPDDGSRPPAAVPPSPQEQH